MTAPEAELDYAEAAALLRVSEDWLRHHAPREFPHYKKAGRVTFGPQHIEAIRALHERNAATPPGQLRPRRKAS